MITGNLKPHSLDGLNSRVKKTKDKLSEFKERSIEFTQSEPERKEIRRRLRTSERKE